MNNVAHTDKKGIDLNEDGEVLATVANMEEYAAIDDPRKVVVWSRETGEQFSATPGDYFAAESGEALVDGLGEDMLLAYVQPERVEPIKASGLKPFTVTGYYSDNGQLYTTTVYCQIGEEALNAAQKQCAQHNGWEDGEGTLEIVAVFIGECELADFDRD